MEEDRNKLVSELVRASPEILTALSVLLKDLDTLVAEYPMDPLLRQQMRGTMESLGQIHTKQVDLLNEPGSMVSSMSKTQVCIIEISAETQQVEQNNEQEAEASLQFASRNQGESIDLTTFGVDVEKPYVIADQGLAGRERFINHQNSSKSIEKPFGGDDFSMEKFHQMFNNKLVSPMPPTNRAYKVYDEKPRRNSELSLPLKHCLFDPGIDNKLVAMVTGVGCLLSVGNNLDFKDFLKDIKDKLNNHCKLAAGEESLSYQHKVVSCLDILKPLLNYEIVQVARLESLVPVGGYCTMMIFVNTKATTETLTIKGTGKFVKKWDNTSANLVGTDCIAGTYCRVVT